MDKPRALVVEDEGSLADIYSEALRAAGFETEVIMGGLTAIMRVAADAPDLIVLDLHLPNISGADILHQIRANERMANTYVIVATADAAMAETVQEEANVVLIKPVSFRQLRDMATRFRLSHTQAD
ncbi:MAG: response regulator [Thermoflexales bacterium]|nr:response regulator [Thermoflexales bacterium]